MKNFIIFILTIVGIVAVILIGYWFWVPDVGSLRTWNDFLSLPSMQCSIGDSSVRGLSGTMYVGSGRLRADYRVEGEGTSATFHTIVYEDGSAYTWADTINFSERGVLNLGDSSTEAQLFSISQCRRVWTLDPQLFVLPLGKEFRDRNAEPEAPSEEAGS